MRRRLAALALMLAGCAGASGPAITPVAVRHGTFVVEVESAGLVQPVDSRTIALESGMWGSIEALAPEGKPVKKGDFLARIGMRDLEEDLFRKQDELADAQSKLKRQKADAPVKRWEIAQEALDKEREWRQAELGYKTRLRGGRKDEREAAKKDLTLAELKLESDTLAKKEALYAQGVLARAERDKGALDRALAEIERKRARLALDLLAPGAREDELAKARLTADKAHAAYESVRIEGPSKESVIQLEADKARMRARRLQKRVAQLESKLGSATLYAPADGLLLYPRLWGWQKVHVGMEVWEGLNFLEVARLDRVKILGAVSEAEIAKVKEGAKVGITADGYPGRVFAGVVARVSKLAKEEDGESAVPGVKRFDVEVRPNGPTPELKPNMKVQLRIVFAEQPQATAVPADAVFGAKGQAYVWLATPKGPEKHPVEAGLASADWVALKQPLPAGAKVYLLDPTSFSATPGASPGGTP